ncbi:MAG: sec-independent translocase [Jatrophihabitans sp.]|uniref:sec-independent translocase n=1 Tax=Jatrophihabitans sp. TaxID=1932789 RepID=UPI003F7E5855
MFNIGPMEMLVLAIVGLVVLGPDRLPDIARDAARLLRTLRDIATGARQQLKDELGPEFADVDLRNLNPRTAVQRALLGEEFDPASVSLRKYHPRNALQDLLIGDPDDGIAEEVASANGRANGVSSNGVSANGHSPNGAVSMSKPDGPSGTKPADPGGPTARPRPRPAPAAPEDAPKYDPDAT